VGEVELIANLREPSKKEMRRPVLVGRAGEGK
jgi:hypothetical protein